MLNETCQFLIPKLRLFQYTRFLLLHFSESGLRCKECGSDVSHWVVFSVLCQFCFTRLSSALVIFTVDFKQNLATSLANYCPAWYLSESPLHCIRIRGGDIEQNRLARGPPAARPLPAPATHVRGRHDPNLHRRRSRRENCSVRIRFCKWEREWESVRLCSAKSEEFYSSG